MNSNAPAEQSHGWLRSHARGLTAAAADTAAIIAGGAARTRRR